MLELLCDWLLPLPPANCFHPRKKLPDRRTSVRYKKKRELVKTVWITMGLIMLSNPALPFVAVVSLFTTFLSFVILDETP